MPDFCKVAKTVAKTKKAKIKVKFESPKHLHQTTFVTLKFKPCFEPALLGYNVKILLKQKVAQNVTIFLGYFIFTKNRTELPKVAQTVNF